AGLSIGHACLIHGLKAGEATAIMPFDYTRLIFAGAAGYYFFAEQPSVVTILGAVLIMASTLYIARQESREKRIPDQLVAPG
ncbi:MAG: DMT family transporter, partial [Alphaproteobacteria bacterium]|nr:DMT family transporter [Alphaproteobacteria bacterium]